MQNPFILVPYVSEELFCDRVFETELMEKYLTNGSNITLISPRRYGKTGLIRHLFHSLSAKSDAFEMYYVDIYPTRSIDDFIQQMTESMVTALKRPKAIQQLLHALAAFRPMISYDPLTGNPQVTLTLQNDQERKGSLQTLLECLERRPRKVIVAIDEFQQIREYEGVNMEALLRAYIQPLHNVQFIFCGSKKHVMSDMFSEAHSPFYESTRLIWLDKIDRDVYATFIRSLFAKGRRDVDDDALAFILDWTCAHTFYTQMLCNRIYMDGSTHVSLQVAMKAAAALLDEGTAGFLERRNLLTAGQWTFLQAVAKEGGVAKPTASAFLKKFKIGTAAGARRTLQTLVDKELIVALPDTDGTNVYYVYNVFFSRWLETRG